MANIDHSNNAQRAAVYNQEPIRTERGVNPRRAEKSNQQFQLFLPRTPPKDWQHIKTYQTLIEMCFCNLETNLLNTKKTYLMHLFW